MPVHGQFHTTTEGALSLEFGPEAGDALVELLDGLPKAHNLLLGSGESHALCLCLQGKGLRPIAEFALPGTEISLLNQVIRKDFGGADGGSKDQSQEYPFHTDCPP